MVQGMLGSTNILREYTGHLSYKSRCVRCTKCSEVHLWQMPVCETNLWQKSEWNELMTKTSVWNELASNTVLRYRLVSNTCQWKTCDIKWNTRDIEWNTRDRWCYVLESNTVLVHARCCSFPLQRVWTYYSTRTSPSYWQLLRFKLLTCIAQYEERTAIYITALSCWTRVSEAHDAS